MNEKRNDVDIRAEAVPPVRLRLKSLKPLNVPEIHREVFDIRNNRGGWHEYQPYITIGAASTRWLAATTDAERAREEAMIQAALKEMATMPAEFKPKPKRKK